MTRSRAAAGLRVVAQPLASALRRTLLTMGGLRLKGLSATAGATVARKASAAPAGAGVFTTGSSWRTTDPPGALGSPEGPLGVPAATGEALTVDVMPPWSVAGCVRPAEGVGPEVFAELGVESPAAGGGAALDVVLAEPTVGDVEGWSAVGCVGTTGGGVPDADETSDAALGGGGGSAGGVGGAELVVGGVIMGSVGGAGVAVGGAVGGGVAVGASAVGMQSVDVPVAGNPVGVHVARAAAGSAIDADDATVIIASCRRTATAIARINRCAPWLDMHVLRLILAWPPKLTTTTSYVDATVSYAVVANHPTVSAKLIIV